MPRAKHAPANQALLTIAQAARALPVPTNPSTVWRWVSRGCRGVRLQVVRQGGRVFIDPKQLDAFNRAINGCSIAPTKERKAAIDAATAELDAIGI